MGAQILFCASCRSYTLKDSCAACGSVAVPVHPARYQPGFSHHAQRREARRAQLAAQGLL